MLVKELNLQYISIICFKSETTKEDVQTDKCANEDRVKSSRDDVWISVKIGVRDMILAVQGWQCDLLTP